ncbi:MAG: hypothetical protein LBP22_13580 [Deltaproteobacteria bacterium]|nr:hypothetical protein [Deltaproteobacteria bacterium]
MLLLAAPVFAFEWSAFSTLNHPKANGLNMSARFPAHYSSREGNRPHIVRVFSDRNSESGFVNVLILQVNPLSSADFSMLNTVYLDDNFAEEFIKTQLEDYDPDATVVYTKKTKHEGQNAVISSYFTATGRAGKKNSAMTDLLNVFYNNSLISSNCSTFYNNKYDINDVIAYYKNLHTPLYFQHFNSLILLDRY